MNRTMLGLISLFIWCHGSAWTASADPLVDRGRYLVTIGICESCHTPKDQNGAAIAKMRLAGGTKSTSGGTSTNLTPDPETGIGSWSDEQIIHSFRNGKRPDGSTVGPPMAIYWYRQVSDSDSKAIVAYLRTVPAVRNAIEHKPVVIDHGPEVKSVADVDPANKIAYGAYIAGPIAHCMNCHTPRNGREPDMSRAGAGGNSYRSPNGGTVIANNLTPGNAGGIARWTDAELKVAIRTGVRPGGGAMAPVMAFDSYSQMTEEDLNALVAYLRSLKPIAAP